jgi:hypothetical protein
LRNRYSSLVLLHLRRSGCDRIPLRVSHRTTRSYAHNYMYSINVGFSFYLFIYLFFNLFFGLFTWLYTQIYIAIANKEEITGVMSAASSINRFFIFILANLCTSYILKSFVALLMQIYIFGGWRFLSHKENEAVK